MNAAVMRTGHDRSWSWSRSSVGVVVAVTPLACTVCGQPVDLDDCHQAHAADCPMRGDFDPRTDSVAETCACDAVTHPDCCEECAA